MAHTLLSDVFIPEVYLSYQTVDDPELSAFYQSGVAVSKPFLEQAANSGGSIVHIPFWNDIDPTKEPNYSDDTTTQATPDKIVSGNQLARNAYLNYGLSSADLSAELAGSDPLLHVRRRFSTYWIRQFERRVINSLLGIAAAYPDMVENIAIEDGDSADETNVWSRKAFTSAAFTLGDHFQSTSAIAVHSIVYKRMVDNDDIEFIKDSTGSLMIPTFMGRRVVVDDSMPVVAGTASGFKYTSILFGSGAVGFGSGTPRVPAEVHRAPASGNGGGIETIWERKTWLCHPDGFHFNSTAMNGGSASDPAGVSATLADLRTVSNWTRVVPRKAVPVAFLVTNG